MPNQVTYEQAKASTAVRAGQSGQTATGPASSPNAGGPLIASGDPDIYPAWTGVRDNRVAPPDTIGAVGPTRYIELTNLMYAIYDRTGGLLSTGGLASLAGDPLGDLSLTDPQIIWDPGTNRFYYVILSTDTNSFDVGFSKTASPNSSSDWCRYFADFGYGSFLPDYPKLGDTRDFWLFGVNVFSGFTYLGSDIDWLSKPPAGAKCPSPSTFNGGVKVDLTLHDGNPAFTPVPANQTDTSGTGYVVAAKSPFFPNPNDFIDTFAVTKNPATGDAVFALPVAHSVTAFSAPPNAPQLGTAAVLDTLDGRLTNAVSGFDPFRGKTAVWTQHTVAGGAGSEVRWYEIDPTAGPLLQPRGAATSGSLYVFNGAISPDRKVSGSIKRFGDAAVVGFNTSSSSTYVHIRMVSKWGNNAQSEFVDVKASPGFNSDFSCPNCRWGDYSGASPDPASNQYSNHGRVWLSNQWNVASNSNAADWRTYIWGTNPAPYVILNGPTKLFQKSKSFAVKWFLGNQASVADVQYRRAPWNGGFGVPVLWRSKVPAGSASFTGTFGNTYCFSAQSWDDIAGPGFRSWGFGPERCAVVPLDDRSLNAPAGGWSRLNGSGYFNNTFSRTITNGKYLTRTGIHTKSAQIMVTKCPSCGKIKIYWNGSLKHTYNLHRSSTKKKVYLSAVSFGSVQVGTLKIVAVLTSGQKVVIDALGVSAV